MADTNFFDSLSDWWNKISGTTTTNTTTPSSYDPAVIQKTYPNYQGTPYDEYTLGALKNAQGLISNTGYTAYPEYVASQQKAPTQTDYVEYNPISPLANVTAPNYKNGLFGGDYDALQTALTTPGANAATTAYNQGTNNLTNVMGGRGLYGSSIMQNQQTNALDAVYQKAMADNAANAAAQRYALQQKAAEDENQFYATIYPNQLQAANDQYKAGLLGTQDKRSYDVNKLTWDKSYQDALTAWENAKSYEKYQYDLANRADKNAWSEQQLNSLLAFAGQGAPLVSATNQATSAYNNYLAAINASNKAYDSANQAGWLGAAGTIGAGLLKNEDLVNSIGNVAGSATDSLVNMLFGSGSEYGI
jgi:hypothetical protein